MKEHFNKFVSVEMAKKLMRAGYPVFKYDVYNDGRPYFDIPEYGQDGWEEGDRYRIPTYAEVFDWFISNHIFITFTPAFTFALKGKMSYTWMVSYPDIKECHMVYHKSDEWSSLKLAMDDAIDFALGVEIPKIEEDTDLA